MSPSSKQARRVRSYSEEMSSSDEEQESSPSSPLSSPNTRLFFDITVESYASSSTYLCFFSEEAIGVTTEWNLFGYMCQHSSLYRVTRDPSDEARSLFSEEVQRLNSQ
jgi:hypothetical protein